MSKGDLEKLEADRLAETNNIVENVGKLLFELGGDVGLMLGAHAFAEMENRKSDSALYLTGACICKALGDVATALTSHTQPPTQEQ